MSRLELNTASALSDAQRTQSHEELRFEDTIQHGQPATIVRDQNGSIAYPSYVPQPIKSPTSADSPTSTASAQLPEPLPKPLVEDQQAKKAQTDPPAPEKNKAGTGKKTIAQDGDRPAIDHVKRWATEGSRRGRTRTGTFPPAPKRAGTSYLDKAIWVGYEHDEDSSSSSSSSSDDETHAEERRAKRAEEKRKRDCEDRYGRFRIGNENYKTKGKVKNDGRLRITVKETANTGYLAKALGVAKRVSPLHESQEGAGEAGADRPAATRFSSAGTATSEVESCPRLNIVIMVIGSRGDAQPFLKIGKILKEQYGHRVRIATHPAFREFVEKDSGLEFFSVGGDPSELMAFMVKNPGMIPSLEAVRAGDIGRRRAAMAEMFGGFWRACVNATDDEKDVRNLKMMGEKVPFIADAIIANPPSFAHIHCAEALGVPLHLMFTFPYTPTNAFPHPLASIKKSNVDPGYTNFISYPMVEMMVWQGLGDLVNDFRVKTLGLDPVSTLWAPGQTYRLHVPFTYLWSPGLVPKPEDWGPEVDVSGFVFLDLASTFKPPKELEAFLDHDEPPIYIGFGSIVVDDPNHFTSMVFDAVKLSGVRALVSKGWGGLGCDDVPDNIYMLENTPHDWLFPKVRACVIHGGAGTTAIALKCGKPIMIVPFFGDQHFWGSMVANAGAGPEPVPYKHLTAEKLAEGIKYCLTPEAQEQAGRLAKDIELEGDGAANAVRSFHHHLHLRGQHSMRCSILQDRVATWQLKDSSVKLSALAADIAVEKGLVQWKKLRLLRHMEWNDFEGPGEPVTGAVGAMVSTVGNAFGGIGGVPLGIARLEQRRWDRRKRHKARKERKMKARVEARKALNAEPGSRVTKGAALGGRSRAGTLDLGKQKDRAQDAGGSKCEEPREENKSKPPVGDSPKVKKADDQAGDPGNSRVQHPPDDDAMSTKTDGTAGGDMADAYVNEVVSGVGQTASAILRGPVDLSMALAQGFHNAPRLYGDQTVRRPIRVTGMRSGVRAARREFALGIYDGFTGLVKQPVAGFKEDGVKGLLKGTGMGLTGFVLKNIGAMVGPVGYTLQGVAKQVGRSRQPAKMIRRARIFQGERDAKGLGKGGEGEVSGSGLDRNRNRRVVEDEVERGWGLMQELWHALEEAERKKGMRGWVSARKQRGKGAAFESIEIAEQALAALRSGESISTVVGTEKELRKSAERGRAKLEEEDGKDKKKKQKGKKEKSGEENLTSAETVRDAAEEPKKQGANGNAVGGNRVTVGLAGEREGTRHVKTVEDAKLEQESPAERDDMNGRPRAATG